jgi:hypothetical protein
MNRLKVMKQWTGAVVLTALFFTGIAGAEPAETPLQASPAFKNYLNRPKTELSKLVYLMDRFKGTDAVVIYEGRQYPYKEALPKAKGYLKEHYKDNAPAEAWIAEHCYRSRQSNKIIHVKHPDGRMELLRDVLLTELKALNQVAIS